VINQAENYVAWALLIDELDEAKDHIGTLTAQMASAGRIDDSEYATRLAHIYAHLNRAWHGRNVGGEATAEQRESFSKFPQEISPIG
jgi:hypothetical protein